ncbi:MAG: hypothetical protein JRI23_19255 [Deltaproteobacteria bacterium]|jgi:hypothetical protein|nr:hypothetical protein [Deltaproteobacteria bacterium]MBW2534003.1 hypothetical protein [Deltaproteobacteria bacterium]
MRRSSELAILSLLGALSAGGCDGSSEAAGPVTTTGTAASGGSAGAGGAGGSGGAGGAGAGSQGGTALYSGNTLTHVLSNVYENGGATGSNVPIVIASASTPCYWIDGNTWDDGSAQHTAQVELIRYSSGGSADGELASAALFTTSGMAPLAASSVKAKVQSQAGAQIIGGGLGPVTAAIMAYSVAGTGSAMVDHHGTYPAVTGSPGMPADADGDGLSDGYEATYGSSAPTELIADGSAWHGYMHIERANWELVGGS